MRLADFIQRDLEAILIQWEAFAATLLPAAADMDSQKITRSRGADLARRVQGSGDIPKR
jgi:hypothetical protein